MTSDTWRARFMRGECGVESLNEAVAEFEAHPLSWIGSLRDELGLSWDEWGLLFADRDAFANGMEREREAGK